MSILQHRQRLHKILLMLGHHQFQNAPQVAKVLKCHPSTVKRLLARLRFEGHQIKYEKSIKRYVLEE